MSSPVNTGTFPKALRSDLYSIAQLGYDMHPDYLSKMFFSANSKLKYEENLSGNPLGLAPVKPEGSDIEYQSESQGYVTRVTHKSYASGIQFTQEFLQDNQYDSVLGMGGASNRLGESFMRTKQIVGANIYNRAFNSAYTYGDGKELIATDHPTLAGNQSNKLAIAADLSEASLEDLCIQIRKATDNNGNLIGLQPIRLLYAPDNKFNACRILESELQNDTANNAVNALKSKGVIPEHLDNPYLDDADAWFVLTNESMKKTGLVFFQRTPLVFQDDFDTNNLNKKFFGFERYSFTSFDWRSIYGSAGS